jgi:HAD superfamily hydrolase (TIGR01509 family)
MADTFVAGLGRNGDLYTGAIDVLTALSGQVSLALVSNGLGEVVHARLARLGIESLFDAVIVSSEVGSSKPGSAIFDATFQRLGSPPKAGALMVGDSLSSDIAGGAGYGIATCWYNPHGKPAPDTAENTVRITHQISALTELLDVVNH